MNRPTRPTMPALGMRAADVVAMDKEYEDKSVQPRINAYLEQKQMEEHGIWNQLSEMQQNSWKVFEKQKIKTEPFKLRCCLNTRSRVGSGASSQLVSRGRS